MTKIAIYGSGYVGLVSGVCFAERGHEVLCVDIDENKIQLLQKGEVPIVEENLPELLEKNQKAGRILFSSKLADAVRSDYHFIAVGTPEGKNGEADLTLVNAVVSEINRSHTEPFVIVLKSTVPVGTAEKMRKMLLNEQQTRNQNVEFHVISNPEFLREGKAIYDCLHPDRIVLGGDDINFLDTVANDIYGHYIEQKTPILKMTSESAELTKYATNALLAMKITFMNELSLLAERTGADIELIRKGIGLDERLGPHFIAAGCGYGGSCFPKDVKALIAMFEKNDCEAQLIKQVPEVNQKQMERFCGKILRYFSKQEDRELSSYTLALWGLAFKPGTDDIRESPAIYIASRLSKQGIKIRAYDPAAMSHADNFSWVECTSTPESALEGADALIIATDWPIFEEFDLNKMASLLKSPVIFDGRNIYDKGTMDTLSFDYISVGRPDVLGRADKT
jgi:UDPglucose 6-dehydrogenase